MTTFKHLIWIFLISFIACKDKEIIIDTVPEPIANIECIQLFDYNGQTNGTYGSCNTGSHWGSITLTAAEKSLLDFQDTVSLAGTASSKILTLSPYPLPIAPDKVFRLYLNGEIPNEVVKLKFVIVDETNNVIERQSLRVKTDESIALMADATKYKPGVYHRIYYRVNAVNSPDLFEGYGNIFFCIAGYQEGSSLYECF